MNAATNSVITSERPPFARSLRVLVADDNRDTVITLVTLLRDDGHDAKGVYCAADVMAMHRSFEPDVFILDLAMPDQSGYDLARAIRAYGGTRKPLLIAITGQYKRPADALLSRAVGFDHHLIKPYDPAALLDLLKASPEDPEAA